MSSIFDSGPEFYWNSQPIQPRREFQQIIDRYWKEFCKNVIDWIMIAGIVPIAFEKVDKNYIPIVPKGQITLDYNIQMVYKGGRVIYQYVKLRSRKTGEKITPRVDKKVTILSGFGWDPMENGKIKSIVSSIISADYFISMIIQYTLRAEFNRSDPELVTEVTNETMGLNIPQYGHFGDWDQTQYQEQSRYRLNTTEVMAVMEQQRQIVDATPSPTLNAMGEPMIDRYKKQSQDNVRNLPVNHKLTRQNMPESRSDLVPLIKHYEGIICMSYRVPRTYLIADDGMSETSVRLTQDTYSKTINSWKNILSGILTNVYNFLYYSDDIKSALGIYTDLELNDMNEEQLFDKSQDPRVTIGFSLIPTDSSEGLLQKYTLGLIDWDNFQQMSMLMGGYPNHLMNQHKVGKKKKDPWNQDYKLNMLRSGSAAALAKLGAAGTVVFPQQKIAPQQSEQQQTSSSGSNPEQKKKKEQKRSKKQDEDEESEPMEPREKPKKKQKKSTKE